MALVIISQNDAGGVSITTPAGEFTAQQILDKGLSGRFARIINSADLPEHPEFSDAWEMDAKTLTVNFAKAQEITKNRLRAEREPLLAVQDVLFMKALETGADTKAIVAEKNRLRDVTKLADAAKTLDDLLAITCEG
jgi:hypothetical protein